MMMNQGAQLAAMDDASSWALERWQALLADYNNRRLQFIALRADPNAYGKIDHAEQARVEALFSRMQSFEAVITKIGEFLQTGADVWADVRTRLASFNPLSGLLSRFGLGEFPPNLGVAPLVVPVAGLAVLGIAIWQIGQIIQQMIPAIEAMSIAKRVAEAGGTPEQISEAARQQRQAEVIKQITDSLPLVLVGGAVLYFLFKS